MLGALVPFDLLFFRPLRIEKNHDQRKRSALKTFLQTTAFSLHKFIHYIYTCTFLVIFKILNSLSPVRRLKPFASSRKLVNEDILKPESQANPFEKLSFPPVFCFLYTRMFFNDKIYERECGVVANVILMIAFSFKPKIAKVWKDKRKLYENNSNTKRTF